MSETIDGNAGTRIVHAPDKPVTPPPKYLASGTEDEETTAQNPLDSKSDTDNVNLRKSVNYSAKERKSYVGIKRIG